jgi:signal transduction histidine kinase
VTEQLLAETTPRALENIILRSVTTSFQAVFAGIYRVSAESGILEKVCTVERPNSLTSALLQQDLVEMAIADGEAILVNANTPDEHEAIQGLMREMGWGSILVVPVRRNKVQYAFCACRASGEPGFQQADLEFLVILARQAVVAMENTRLYVELKDIVRREEESQRALIQAEKMAAVGRLVASLAHEINNPLQSVRNCLHLAARQGIDPEQRMKYLEMTDSELERLVQTVRRMLNFYRLGGADREKTDIRQIIEQVLALLSTQLNEQSIKVHVQYLGLFQCVSVVYDQIQQVIFNLLINAIDALSEIETGADEKRVSKSSSSAAKEIWIDVSFEKQQVHIWIEDSGPGIPVELRERVFEPFVSTKPSGTGLGLAVCYGIMEQHQGQLKVIPSRYHNGACFEIILPVGDDG